jgi:hypothetical protein
VEVFGRSLLLVEMVVVKFLRFEKSGEGKDLKRDIGSVKKMLDYFYYY